MFCVEQADCFNHALRIDNGSVDLIITDPPYESLEEHRAKGTTTRLKKSKASNNEWFGVVPNERLEEMMGILWDALCDNSHCYVFSDVRSQFHIVPAAQRVGFKFWNAIVWDKMSTGMGYHYRRSHELILFFEKGKRKLNDLGMRDVIACPRVSGRNAYPTQKPISLMSKLVIQSTSSYGIQTVFDPFCGSGSVGVAAIDNGCCFVGRDISESAVRIAVERCRQAELGLASD